MAKKLQFVLLCLLPTILLGQTTLSSEAEISVLTIGPGSSLNDAFGHNAFRIKDPINHIDETYDYGRYDFDAPNFYLKFAQGKLNYAIGKSSYSDFLGFYVWQKRTVQEQVLNLSSQEKQTIYQGLVDNYKPENRYYLYDFFYDNCATKIRDVLKNNLAENITWNQPPDYQEKTFRTLIQDELYWNTWGSMGIDLALGSVIDQVATPEEQMFLPKNIHSFFEQAKFEASQKDLVASQKTVYDAPTSSKIGFFLTSPLVIWGIMAAMIIWITYLDFKHQKGSKWLDVVLFSMTGLIGVVLLLLWFATDHSGTIANYNLLWAFPLNLLLLPKLISKSPKPWVRRYLKFLLIMMGLLVFHWIFGVQVFAPTLIPIFLAISVRYIYLIRFLD